MNMMVIPAMTILIGLIAAGCAQSNAGGTEWMVPAAAPVPSPITAPFVHAVFFELKPDTPEAEVDSLIDDAYRLLAGVPSVRKIDSGRRDARMARDVNDKTFAVGLVVFFDDKDGHDVYATHPLHQQYIDKHKEHWANVRVFDYVAR